MHGRVVRLQSPADRDLPGGDRAVDRWRARLVGAAGFGAAASRFPDGAGDDTIAGRQSRRDRVADHSTTGASARANSVAVVDDLDQFVRRQPDFPAVRSQPRHRRRHPGRTGRDQRRCRDTADTILAQRLSQISGVGRVAVLGGLKPAVRVQADLARLAAYGIAMEDLRNAIAGANVSGPKGSLDGAQQAYTIAANDQIAAADAYRPIIVAYRNGAPVTIGDIAQIVDGLENDRTGGWYQGTPAVIIDIQRQPGANVIEVVRQIREEIPKLQRAIPAGVNLTVVSDRTVTIRASVHDVQFTLILSVVLVTLVVLLFLRSLRATLIAGVALPLSLITSFGVMYFANFSLDNLSLMALTIGTGFVVDDAIVMIENIVRHMENGETAMDASLRGASEIGFTVISLTVSLIAVFIPLLFMSGLVGRMFREFALTLTIAVVTSAIVSLTLTPMMCSRLLKHAGEELVVPGLATISHGIDRMVEFYHRTLLWVLDRQRATMMVTFATIAATLILYVVAPKGFLPLQDTASITAVTPAD